MVDRLNDLRRASGGQIIPPEEKDLEAPPVRHSSKNASVGGGAIERTMLEAEVLLWNLSLKMSNASR